MLTPRPAQDHQDLTPAWRVPRVVLAWTAAALAGGSLFAATVPTGFQAYHIIGHEQHVWDMMFNLATGEGAGSFDNSPTFINGMSSVVTATASADNQILYYDHWEDGFEADVLSPVQATTLVLGDGNLANGQACDFTTDPRVAPCDGIDDDVLFQGTDVTLNSDQGLPGVIPNPDPGGFCQAGLPAPPADRRCSVPVNPRLASDIRFDGGDYLVTSGGPISLVHTQEPLSPYIGGATEIISYQAVANANSYSIPVGVDSYLGDNTVTEPFKYVDLNLVAYTDGTQVLIDSPGAGGGTVSFTLNRGQHYSSTGLIDTGAAPAITITAGTKVSTTDPLAGLIFTGGDGTFATRFFALLPDLLHSTDYIMTAPGDNPGVQGSRPLNLYLFNPDPLNPIDVTVTDSVGTVTIPAIAPNSMIDYRTATGRYVPNGSTVRLTSNRNFWGVSAYDHQSPSNDWGHSWLARRFVTTAYTVSYAPGVDNPAYESQPAQRLANDPDCTIPPAAPIVCDSLNRSPVFISATEDNTLVQIDFDNDGVYDPIDTFGDDYPNAAPLPNNTYVINALQSLRVYDWTDYDNTGTRIATNKPVAVAYGQDTDQATGPDPIQDTGYTVYPINQAFLDPVLVITKESDVTTVPTAGGAVVYTLTIESFAFGPLTNLEVWDLLPPGVSAADYVPGSTLVTYPDLSQDTTDPVPSIDPATGRDRLDWTLSPDTLDAYRKLTVRYTVSIPAGPIGLLTNEAHAQANLGGSVFSPSDTADVVRTDVNLGKLVSDYEPEAGDTLTFTLEVTHNGAIDETNVVITDPVPPDATFAAGSIVDAGPFTGTFDPAQNAVVWTAALFAAGTGPFSLSFDVVVNPGVPAGTVIANRGSYESIETPYFLSNEVDPVVVGPELAISKTGPALLHPNEIAIFEIHVENSGAGAGNLLVVADPFPTNTTYVAGSMEWQLNADPFVALTDAADTDEGTAFVDRVELAVAELGPGQDLTFRFRVRVDPGTAGLFVNNQATVSSTEVPPTDTNLLSVPIVGDADLTGHVFLDLDGNGVQGPGEPDLAGVDVVVIDAMGNPQIATTDSGGDYLVTVEPGLASLDVDESDPDFPAGAALTTGNDPQNLVAVSGGSVAATPVGYQPPPLSFVKSSDAVGGEVVPGQMLTYTLELANNTSVVQTGIAVTDPLPAGTLAVPGTTQVAISNDVVRVSEYFLPVGTFSGTSYDLTLNQDLAADYFVILRGSDGNGTDLGDRGPDENYAALTRDPFATGQLAASGAADLIRLERGNAVNSWVGVVTVVECLRDCANHGFSLLDVRRVDHAGATVAGAVASAVTWTDVNQVMLMGGFNGAGCITAEAATANTKVCHARIYPSGVDQINWTRDAGGAVLSQASSTVMVVEWGSAWTVQRVRVQGNNGGDGINAVGEYNTAAIAAVARANTWVWGTGHTNDQGIGDAAEGVALTLGDGVNQNATETAVAAGIEYVGNAVDFEVYALTHPDLAVDYRFKADGNVGDLTVDVAVDAAPASRFALSYNGCNGTGNAYPRPIFSARYLTDTTIRLERRRYNQPFPAWVQGIDSSGLRQVTVSPGNDPPNLVVPADGYTLEPGVTMTVTWVVQVDPDLAPAITQIVNVASASTVEQPGPINASHTDDVIRLAVSVEPNNAGFAIAGGTVTYTHEVVNTGDETDSYNLTVRSELGWTIELIDPDTGVVLATDSDGDGVWDGGVTINTGSLDPGESSSYRVRVNVPPATPLGSEETTTLDAVSDRYAAVKSFATDETTVLDAIDVGPVMLLPDYSGVVTAGGAIAYTHSITNNTGATDTFDLVAVPADPTWTATIYNDSNSDGVYTPGIDVAIANTLQLADGELQTFFVVVDAPLGALAGDYDVVHLTATSRNDPDLWDGASDTTTITPAEGHDLSGGGTLLVAPGDTPIFPGTLKNLSDVADTFDFLITASLFLGRDGLNHPSQLWIDTDGDGTTDLQIAEDADGDGTWDTIAPGYDANTNGEPDVGVPALGELAYEVRRPVDPAQLAYRDPVTLSAVSWLTSDIDSVTPTNLLAGLTHALLAGFEVSWSGEDTVVAWRTVSEVGTVGFHLDRRPAAGGRWQRLNRRLLPGLLHAPQGGTYRWVDATAMPGRSYLYQLIEIDSRGGERRFAPLAVTIDPNAVKAMNPIAGGYDKQAHRSSLRPQVEATPGSRAMTDDGATQRVKIRVRSSGLVYVDAAALAAAFGETPEAISERIRRAGLRLYTETPGAPADPCVAGKATAAGEIFRDGFESGDLCAWSGYERGPIPQGLAWLAAADAAGLYFYGEAIDSIYTEENVYWIESLPGVSMPTVDGGAPAPASGETYLASRHLEEEFYPLTSVIEDPDSDFWFWEFFLAGDASHGHKTFTIDTPGREAAGSAALVVHLRGQTDAEVEPDHHAEVRLNGTLIGDIRWDGSDACQKTIRFDATLLHDGANEVGITALLESGVGFDIFYLEAFDVTYPRFYRAVDDRLEASADTHPVMTFEGFSRPDVAVFDISEPQQPRQTTGLRIDEVNGAYRLSFRSSAPDARYLALPLAIATVAIPEADEASNLRATDNQADYLVIAAAGLESAANELANYRRQQQDFKAHMVRLEDIYDEFNHGVESPWAIRDFLDYARTSWELGPRYVVLVGDGSFDYKDRLGTGENLLPVPMVSTPDGLVPSDHRLVDLAGDDGVPEIAVGRLPVRTNAELGAYVDKLRAYESAVGGWKSHTLWVADNVDEGGEFVADSDGLLGSVPAGYTRERIYVDELGAATSRQRLLAAFEAGALLLNYLGHAGLDRLADEGLLLTGDVASLTNQERTPIVVALTCSVGRFDLPGYDTLTETLVLHDAGGAVALWSPTGLSFNADAVVLGDEFLRRALETPSRRLGDIVVEALAAYLSTLRSPHVDIPYIFTLIGDPALRVGP